MTTNTIWIIPVEPINTRYTGEWYTHLPNALRAYAKGCNCDVNVEQIEVEAVDAPLTPGAFLNFAATGEFKARQLAAISQDLQKPADQRRVQSGDTFLFTDAWNPNVLALRYMLELNNLKCTLVGLWHAGAYDPHDFLGRAPNDRGWLTRTEAAMHAAFDINVFATPFSSRLFKMTHHATYSENLHSGWPMEYLLDSDYLIKYRDSNLRASSPFPRFVFPHRLSIEKHPEFIEPFMAVIRKAYPEASIDVCQSTTLTKDEYHRQLASAHYVVSFSDQETLGIGTYEAMLLGTIPFVPRRLSYEDLYYAEECRNQQPYFAPALSSTPEEYAESMLSKLKKYDACQHAEAASFADRVVSRFFNGRVLYRKLVEPYLKSPEPEDAPC